ncbi:VOC family protein [Neobacillus sp. PS3-34]|uniref:VOC family protein n=1 Tax=Neobacillus sp. PS3-34 TaxID=3070678 RepID=UPI0027E2022B|nr:VOC family protein [Neobacillus sp. PS3-34]WML48324.1 VOC family protein [Neobacillus sp. PS3-34]
MNFHGKPNTFVSQVDLKVSNLERSLIFYQNVVGFKILEQTATTAKLTADGKTPMLTLEQPARAVSKQRNTTGLYHFAILLPQRSDLGRVLEHLIQLNYPLGAADHYVSEALYLQDPDDNGIEIYWDRPASTWDWKNGEVAMATEQLDARSILAEGKGMQWNGLPEGTIIGHIHLHVSDLNNTEEFYVKGLGFNVVNHFGNQALFISTGNYHHHIGLNTWAGEGAPAPSENSVGLNWFSIVLPSEDARKNVINELVGMGASVKEEDGVFITADPSGNRIQLLV